VPNTTIHHGASGGILTANNSPVSRAESAMIGYVVLLISFPVQMTSWLPPHEIAAQVPGFMDG
jgi:hypothetical protein